MSLVVYNLDDNASINSSYTFNYSMFIPIKDLKEAIKAVY